jgi:hypothetical protein
VTISHTPAHRHRGRALLALVPVAPLLLAAGWATGARADDSPYVPADGSHPITVTYAYTGAPETFTVPAGVTSLDIVAHGASGGSATADFDPHPSAPGGRGAAVSGTVTVEPGTVLSVNVGGRGGPSADGAAGWNGGGAGGAANIAGAGGGGATDVRTCTPDASGCDSLGSRLVVAGGGGGAGFSEDEAFAGADAETTGTDFAGVRGTVNGGGAGTQETGGSGGAAGNESDRISAGGDGVLGGGGVGGGRTGPDYVANPDLPGFEFRGAGAGGGGLYGGGGGGDNRYYGAPGGGGSNLVPDGGSASLTDPDADGSLSITYDVGPITTVAIELDQTTLPASGTASTTVTVRPRTASGTGIAGMLVTLSSSDPGQSIGAVTDEGNGDYTTVLHGSTTTGTAILHATAVGQATSPDGTTAIETVGYEVPGISAALTSARPSKAGWYRTPVTATFTCTGSRLVGDCPAPTTLTRSGRGQVVTRTITDDQAGTATVTRSVSIDLAKPVVRVTGARTGATYRTAKKLTCKATDTLSGVASCKVTTTRKKVAGGTQVRWTGTATDRAGNTATTTGRYLIRKR